MSTGGHQINHYIQAMGGGVGEECIVLENRSQTLIITYQQVVVLLYNMYIIYIIYISSSFFSSSVWWKLGAFRNDMAAIIQQQHTNYHIILSIYLSVRLVARRTRYESVVVAVVGCLFQ